MRSYKEALLTVSLGLFACGGSTLAPEAAGGESATAVESSPAQVEPAAPAEPTGPPIARRQDVVDTMHGVKVADPYRWLEDIGDQEVVAWADGQDGFARKQLAARPERAALTQRFKELYYVDTQSLPSYRGGRYFFSKRKKDQEKSVVYWQRGKDGDPRVLFDANQWSRDGSISLNGYYPSWSGDLVAYKKSENNADDATMYVRDIDAGTDSDVDVIPNAKYASVSWTPDGKGFYYEWLPPAADVPVAERPGYTEVRYHALGSDPAKDEVIFPALRDSELFLGSTLTRDGRWLLITLQHGWNRSDVYVKDLKARRKGKIPAPIDAAKLAQMSSAERADYHAAQRGFQPMAVGLDGVFQVQWWQGNFYVHTNYQAPMYRLMKVRPKNIRKLKKWRVLVPESEAKLERARIIGGHLALAYLRNASSELELRTLRGKLVRKIALPGIGSTANRQVGRGGGMLGEPDRDDAYYSFSSFTTPFQIYETSIKSGKSQLRDQTELPLDTANMAVEQVWYPSKDGTKISMFVIHRKDMKRDGSSPTLLYGYGGFNISLTPSYKSDIAVWLEQGGVWAVANLRGGGEYGEAWHRAGKGANKQNVFDDFHAAAEFLVAEKYTTSDTLAIYGGSNGGLLVGAAMTQRPDLYRAVVCSVPLLDMVRYHKFGSGRTWIPEYGTAEKAEHFPFIHAYSPYHHVRKGTAYPSMLMLAADSDDRVDPMHARKFTAAVQWATASEDRPVIMRVERNAGHGGADVAAKSVERSADLLTYLLWQLGETR